jgi:hypothetical protein
MASPRAYAPVYNLEGIQRLHSDCGQPGVTLSGVEYDSIIKTLDTATDLLRQIQDCDPGLPIWDELNPDEAGLLPTKQQT